MALIYKNLINEHIETVKSLIFLDFEIFTFASKIIEVFKKGNKLLIAGNGGSAADSQHFAAELVSRFKKERRGLPVIALTTDTSIITAIGNDYSFDNIFSRQIESLAHRGDIFIGLSTSGNSGNVVKAVGKAKEKGCFTVGILGNDGGIIKNKVDLPIVIQSNNTPRIQECHILLLHIVCEMIEEELFHA